MIRSTKSMVAVLACVLIALAAACGGDSTGPTAAADINGNWALTANISNSNLQITCVANGTIAISQSGQTFTGQVSGSAETCEGPGGTTSGNVDGPITGGQITGSSISYSDGVCNYTGTITGSPANRSSGNVACTIPIQGTDYPFTGTWQISR